MPIGTNAELLTAEEVAAMRANLEAVIQVSEHEWRVLHTLEALMRERDRLRTETDVLRAKLGRAAGLIEAQRIAAQPNATRMR